MAKNSKNDAAAKEQETAENVFSKNQLLAAERFRYRHDAVSAVLAGYPDDAKFTVKAVEQKLENFMKGKVK